LPASVSTSWNVAVFFSILLDRLFTSVRLGEFAPFLHLASHRLKAANGQLAPCKPSPYSLHLATLHPCIRCMCNDAADEGGNKC
jgi:hypothetical protein